MNEVTALVLSLGEETTDRAIASARRQTLPPADVVTVEGVTPFHRAFNTGVARIATELFVQVDADMVLDPGCVARLRDGPAGLPGGRERPRRARRRIRTRGIVESTI